jgi:hypothetical protein
MESTSIDKLAIQGQAAAAKASDIAAPILKKATSQTRAAGKRGFDALGDMVGQARGAATDASDSIIAYTRKNPGKALAFAAVAGALLYALAKANALRRD